MEFLKFTRTNQELKSKMDLVLLQKSVVPSVPFAPSNTNTIPTNTTTIPQPSPTLKNIKQKQNNLKSPKKKIVDPRIIQQSSISPSPIFFRAKTPSVYSVNNGYGEQEGGTLKRQVHSQHSQHGKSPELLFTSHPSHAHHSSHLANLTHPLHPSQQERFKMDHRSSSPFGEDVISDLDEQVAYKLSSIKDVLDESDLHQLSSTAQSVIQRSAERAASPFNRITESDKQRVKDLVKRRLELKKNANKN